MDNQLHPELAFQAGIPQENKQYDLHPSLQMEVLPEPEVQAAPEPEPVPEVHPEPEVETPKERDWRAVRAKADEAKQLAREKEAVERERDFYREQALKSQHRQPEPEEDYRTDTEKRLAREMDELKRQVAEQGKQTLEAQRKAATWKAESELLRDYPDMKKVLSDENVKRLEYEYPHLYNAAISTPDVYTTGSAAYEFIIAKGIYKKETNALNQIVHSNTAQRNANKPRSASTVNPQASDSPIKQANAFMNNRASTDEENKAIYAEMVAATRNKY